MKGVASNIWNTLGGIHEERCKILPIKETSKGKLVKENGTVTFLYCHRDKV